MRPSIDIFFLKINKIDKPLTRLRKKEGRLKLEMEEKTLQLISQK